MGTVTRELTLQTLNAPDSLCISTILKLVNDIKWSSIPKDLRNAPTAKMLIYCQKIIFWLCEK